MNVFELNDGQKQAVLHKDGPMMVLAGPGSGKTTVIVHRLRYLTEQWGVPFQDILVITFTKAAAEEMKRRCAALMGPPAERLAISTFHALFFKILRSHKYIELDQILKDEQRYEAVKSAIIQAGLGNVVDEELVQGIAAEISFVKNDLIDLAYYNSMTVASEDFKNILTLYEDYKKAFKKLDFDDMLEKCYDLLTHDIAARKRWQAKYPYILIDEFQDVNRAQYACIKLLAETNRNLYIVGDDDQSIYKFRGARPEYLLNFSKDFKDTQTAVLDVNYRSTEEIIKFGNRIIKDNLSRYPKKIKGTGRHGPKPKFFFTEDSGKEAIVIGKRILALAEEGTDYNDCCVVYRTNMQSRAFMDTFLLLGIPFYVKDGVPPVYDHWIAKDICAYLRLAGDMGNAADMERIINRPNRFIGKSIMNAARKENIPLIDYIYRFAGFQQWQLNRIDELMFYLKALKSRPPYEGVKYLRQGIGYDGYIEEYAQYRKINTEGLYAILDDLQEGTKEFKTHGQYLDHVQAVLAEHKKQRKQKDGEKSGVVLSTMHSVKGLEFQNVFVTSCVEGIIPYEKSRTAAEIEEERRLFYVALTRAKEQLFLSLIKYRYDKEIKPSRFLDGIVKFKNQE